MKLKFLFIFSSFYLLPWCVTAQDISLYEQFNGRYDFVFLGNTMNPIENSYQTTPAVLTTSTANLNLNPNDNIEKAYLYWAGCGTGDFEVQLNGQVITPDRTFSHQRINGTLILDYFSAFKDVTMQVQATGNGTYTLSDLDVSAFIDYSAQASTNFAGWALIIVYKNNNLPLNQLNVYDGMQAVPDEVNITLDNLNVIDNQNAKIGFLAWEGDSFIANNETLSINGTPLGNPPLNPVSNAFNGTNSFTGSNTLYNMDLDVYNIQNNIQIGDTSALIKLTSDQDFVMINAIVTKFNSQLPDATIIAGNVARECNSRTMTADYTVYNVNSTNPLPPATPIAFYANDVLIGTAMTQTEIAVGGNEPGQITFTLPAGIPDDFQLTFSVDDDGTGTGIVTELIENNNIFITDVSLLLSPLFNIPPNLEACNEGFGRATFDFSGYDNLVRQNQDDTVTYYISQADAANAANPILNPGNYFAQATPQEIFVRIDNANCNSVTSFLLMSKNCPPTVYNYVSANTDGTNDTFFIDGLRDIFLYFDLAIYNRWGALIWEGNNNVPDWDGHSAKGLRIMGNEVPDGTYFYVLDLKDPGYPEPLTGFLYLNR